LSGAFATFQKAYAKILNFFFKISIQKMFTRTQKLTIHLFYYILAKQGQQQLTAIQYKFSTNSAIQHKSDFKSRSKSQSQEVILNQNQKSSVSSRILHRTVMAKISAQTT